jgi:hypothetical protein
LRLECPWEEVSMGIEMHLGGLEEYINADFR